MKEIFGFNNEHKLTVLLVLLLGFAINAVASAGDPGPFIEFLDSPAAAEVSQESDPESKKPVDEQEADGSEIIPDVWCGAISDEKTKLVCWDAYRASLNYYNVGLEHRSKVFKWQHTTTKAIFFVVLILVAIGVYFAWVQFRAGKGEMDRSELEISLKGVKVNSSVLGVIILMISLVFFYLYLRYVYPISELF